MTTEPPARRPRRRLPRFAVAAGAVAVAASVAACGSSGSSGGGAAPATGSAATAAPAPSAGTTVTIKNFTFTPQRLTVKVGATVTWVNDDQTPHDISFKDPAIPQSPALSAGGGQRSWSHTFTTPGTYPYICGIHHFMTGTVTVTS